MDDVVVQPIVVQGNVPAFLLKLWKIVEDPQYNHLISWNNEGKTIKIFDQNEFSKQILPKYYKHNNISSFVRQINMYGFRKIVDGVSGGLKSDASQQWEFFHPFFQKGRADQLHLIKRKVHLKDDHKISSPQLAHVLQDIEKLKNQHETVDERLSLVKTENEMLWREVSDLRDQHSKQQAVISKLIQFFVKLIMGKPADISRKRRALDYGQLMDPKVSKMSQDLLLYNPQTVSNTSFDSNYIVQSPDLEDQGATLVELPPDTIVVDDTTGVVMEDSPSFTTDDVDGRVDATEPITTVVEESSPVILPQSGSRHMQLSDRTPSQVLPLVVKNNSEAPSLIKSTNPSLPVRTTVTIIPSSRRTKSKPDSSKNVRLTPVNSRLTKSSISDSKNISVASLNPPTFVSLSHQPSASNVTQITEAPSVPLLFPNKFSPAKPKPNSIKQEALTTPVDVLPIVIADNDTTSLEMPGDICDNFADQCELMTSLQNIPEDCPSNQMVTTRVQPSSILSPAVPIYQRQVSFKNRNEISSDVEQISKSIDLLQEMLDKQQINLDLKNVNLSQVVQDGSTVSLQDLIRLTQQQEQEWKSENDKNLNQVIPYTEPQLIPYAEPFSPSQLITEDYGGTVSENSRAEKNQLFEDVLSSDSINLDALLEE